MDTFIIPNNTPIPHVESSWKERGKKILFSRYFIYLSAILVVLLFSATGTYLAIKSKADQQNQQNTNFISTQISPTVASISNGSLISPPAVTPTINSLNQNIISPTLIPSIPPSTTAIPNPTNSPFPTPTIHIPNPPVMEISYPSEGQNIEFTSAGQQFCVVDIPVSNTSGLQKKHNINNSGWTSYATVYTLCYSPNEGANTISLQYKNSYGDESTVYTRHFNFHRVQDVTITLSGQIFSDNNCNGTKDGGEGGINTSATVNIFQMPQYYIYGTLTSDSSGNYSFTKTIGGNDSVTLQAIATSPSGYTGPLHYTIPSVVLNSTNKNGTINIPQVPYANYSSCQ